MDIQQSATPENIINMVDSLIDACVKDPVEPWSYLSKRAAEIKQALAYYFEQQRQKEI